MKIEKYLSREAATAFTSSAYILHTVSKLNAILHFKSQKEKVHLFQTFLAISGNTNVHNLFGMCMVI